MSEERKEQVEHDELDKQDGELLPDREAMSIIIPDIHQPLPAAGIVGSEPQPAE